MLKKSNTKLLISAIAVASILGIIFLVSAMRSTPEKTLIKYVKSMEKVSLKQVAKLLPDTDDLFGGSSILSENIIANQKNVKTRVIVDRVIYSDNKKTAEVYYYIIKESKNDKSLDIDYETISMTKRRGRWQVDADFNFDFGW